jgi:hypothetical protein
MNPKINNLIKSIVEWQPITFAVGRNSKKFAEYVEKYGAHGVYLVALKAEISDNIISENIGYVGKSANIFGRIYDIRTGQHSCRTYIFSKNIDMSEVYVKLLLTEPGNETELERFIHSENEANFGYRFKWREASGGNDGVLIRLMEAVDKIDNLDDLKLISKLIDDKATMLFLQNWKIEE